MLVKIRTNETTKNIKNKCHYDKNKYKKRGFKSTRQGKVADNIVFILSTII